MVERLSPGYIPLATLSEPGSRARDEMSALATACIEKGLSVGVELDRPGGLTGPDFQDFQRLRREASFPLPAAYAGCCEDGGRAVLRPVGASGLVGGFEQTGTWVTP